MLISGVDHIHLTAPRGSEARVRAFYGDLLGLREIPKPPQLTARGGVWFEAGNLPLHVDLEDSAPAGARRNIAFSVPDLAAVREALEANAVACEADGAERCFCRDPFGNRVEFVEAAGQRGAISLLAEPQQADEYRAGDGDVERVAVSADGVWLAAGTSAEDGRGQPGLFIWRRGRSAEPEVQIELSSAAWELAFSPGGRELACLSEDGSLELWRVGDFESDQFAELAQGSTGLAYSGDGGLLAVGSGDKVEIYRPGLDQLHTMRPRLGPISALAFDAHGLLAVSGETDRIQLWQIRPVQKSSWDVLGHESYATQLKFNPHHPVLAAITESDQLLVWDINQGPETPEDLTGELTNLNALAFSPDGDLLAVGAEDGRVWLWDWQARRVAGEIATHAPVLCLTFTPDSAQVIVGHEGGRLRVWKIK